MTGRFAATSVALGAGLMLLGCDGTIPEQTPTRTAIEVKPGGPAAKQQPAHDANRAGVVPKDVTPVNPIDTKEVVNVVAAEAKGGEARKPSEEGTLWQYPETSAVSDETLEIEPPNGIPQLLPGAIVPTANPLTKAKFELGKQLYFEPRVSKDGTVSCATCHNPEKGWTDQAPTSTGIDGLVGGRSAPTVINTAFGRSMFWDGRAPSLEAQAQGPIQNPIEMGDQNYDEIINRLRGIPGYQDQFKKVFGTEVTLDGLAKAIATFERVAALSGNSAYDKYLERDKDGHNSALSDSQKRGLLLFGLRLNDDDKFEANVTARKANCVACHVGANFTDEQFHNLGVGWDEAAKKFKDPGRFAVTPVGAKRLSDLGAFKTPTLRDVEHTFPYMHDGSEKTLEAVIELYDRGGNANPTLDKDMKKLNLTAAEKADVVAFLKALTGERQKIDLPKLPPGPDGKSPDPTAALTPPKAKKIGLNLRENILLH